MKIINTILLSILFYTAPVNAQDEVENLKLYVEEGKKWMRNKYGFNSHWSMNLYAKLFYDQFFEYNPDLIGWRL